VQWELHVLRVRDESGDEIREIAPLPPPQSPGPALPEESRARVPLLRTDFLERKDR
jgi:hypothetical protein